MPSFKVPEGEFGIVYIDEVLEAQKYAQKNNYRYVKRFDATSAPRSLPRKDAVKEVNEIMDEYLDVAERLIAEDAPARDRIAALNAFRNRMDNFEKSFQQSYGRYARNLESRKGQLLLVGSAGDINNIRDSITEIRAGYLEDVTNIIDNVEELVKKKTLGTQLELGERNMQEMMRK